MLLRSFGDRCARSRSGPRWSRSGSRREGRWHRLSRARRHSRPRRAACPRSRTAAAGRSSSRPRGGRRRSSPPTDRASRSTSCSLCSTGPTARTARCRASSSSPASRTSVRASSARLSGWTRTCRSGCSSRRGSRSVRTRRSRESAWVDDPETVEAAAEALGYPLFTKPATLGSSVGVSKVHDAGELAAGLEEAFRYARDALVEKAAEGAREIECAVLGNDDPVASVAGEIVPAGPRVLRLRGEVPRRARGAAR